MGFHLPVRVLSAAVLAASLACGGGGGGGGGFTDPGHDPSAEEATALAGIGDSIMQGMDAQGASYGDVGDQTRNSFGQGTSHAVFSLHSRYAVVSPVYTGEHFESVSGAEMIDDVIDGATTIPNALHQAQAVCDQKPLPNRVVILLGANDVCDSTNAASLPSAVEFGAALADALDELGTCLAAGSKVHVLSIPRLDQLYAAVATKTESIFHQNCQEFLTTTFPLCSIAAESPTAVANAIVGYNDAIQDEVEAADTTYAADGVAFTTDWTGSTGTSIGTYVFTADDVSSLDCFHPSVQGQAKLACGAWESWEGLGDASACF